MLSWLTQDHHYGGAFYSGQVGVSGLDWPYHLVPTDWGVRVVGHCLDSGGPHRVQQSRPPSRPQPGHQRPLHPERPAGKSPTEPEPQGGHAHPGEAEPQVSHALLGDAEAEPEIFHLSCKRLCPPQVTEDDNIIVSTGYGRGVSSVKVGVANVPQCLKDVLVTVVTA